MIKRKGSRIGITVVERDGTLFSVFESVSNEVRTFLRERKKESEKERKKAIKERNVSLAIPNGTFLFFPLFNKVSFEHFFW